MNENDRARVGKKDKSQNLKVKDTKEQLKGCRKSKER